MQNAWYDWGLELILSLINRTVYLSYKDILLNVEPVLPQAPQLEFIFSAFISKIEMHYLEESD